MKQQTRCSFCNKKLKLIHFTCKCEKLFCSNHRYAHSHNCTFLTNKQEDSKKKIEEKNPKIVHSKIEKI